MFGTPGEVVQASLLWEVETSYFSQGLLMLQ